MLPGSVEGGPRRIGRYVLGPALATGGMAGVYLGRMSGPAGFGKTVAIKQMHAQFARDHEFITMFLDEARITSGLTHPNIVMTLDVLEEPGELFLVMEYVHGASLSALMKAKAGTRKELTAVPPAIAVSIMVGVLHGLHAAHEQRSEDGEPLAIVHRDVSPQNILISVDGIAKIGDFGIAKAIGQLHSTSEGVTKGKQSYMAPEQAVADVVTARSDIFAAGIVLWEALVGRRLVGGQSGASRLNTLLNLVPVAPSSLAPHPIPPALDQIVLRALSREPEQRFASARAMASALEQAMMPAPATEVGEWVRQTLGAALVEREQKLAELKKWTRTAIPTPTSSARLPAFPSSIDLESSSGATTPALSSDRHPAIDPRQGTKRAILIAVIALVSLSAIACILIVVFTIGSHTRKTVTAAATSAQPAPPPSPPPPPTVEPSAAPPEPETVELEPEPAADASVAASSTTPPPKKPKCRIVPQKDSAGRTVFREVCSP